jgi:IS4 transposase
LHFDVLKGAPCQLAVTPAACSEPSQLQGMLQAGRLYVMDRGYASFELFAEILKAGSSMVARVKDDLALDVQEERPLNETARQAGVVRDVILRRLGTSHHKDVVGRPMRLVIVRIVDRDGQATELWLVTDRLDLDADLVALAYKYRWTVELFFRWLKCILGARHLIASNDNGVLLQMYAALIVCLLIQLRVGRQPTKRTYEAIQFYLLGWVNDAELDAHLGGLKKL